MPSLSRVFASILVNSFVAVFAQVQEPPRQRPGPFLIFGPVKEFRDERSNFSIVNGKPVESERHLVHIGTYNEDGTIQESTTFDRSGTRTSKQRETYTLDGRVLEAIHYDNNDQVLSRTVTSYDDAKRIKQEITYRGDGSVSERTTFNWIGNDVSSESWSYDEKGAVTFYSKTMNPAGTGRTDSVSLDSRGVQESTVTITDKENGREFLEESSRGRFKRQSINSTGDAEEIVNYDREGKILNRECRVREFDSYHNLVKTTRLVAKGDSQEFQPSDITYRTIKYYGKN